MKRMVFFAQILVLFAFGPAIAQPTVPAPPVATGIRAEFTSLRLMRDKGILTEAEYDSALRDVADSVGSLGADSLSFVLGRWSTTLYGFVEADHMYDSTQSFSDVPSNAPVKRPGTYAGDNGRLMFGVRNSRLGFRLRAPEFHRIRTSAMLEMDFLGNQPSDASEAQFFTNPAFRLRHFNLKIETPWFDVLIGQYWQLFGWQSIYQPNTVEIQGVPGQLYGRAPQIRLSKTVKTDPITLELAIAALRPPQRDSYTPEGQAGIRLAVNHWTGMQTAGATGTTLAPLSLGVSGDVRRFSLPEFTAAPAKSVAAMGWALAADAFIPILPATREKKGNSLSINGEFAYGYGTADLYTGLNGGVTFPTLPNPTMASPAPAYAPDIDKGLAVFNPDGTLDLIQWTTFLVGVQYYLPGLDGRCWVSGNYSRTTSNNARNHGSPNVVRNSEEWADANLFGDLTPSVRLGIEYAWFNDHYVDGVSAINQHIQFSAFYLF